MADYGKKPMWQWILMYVVIGGIIYFLIYYFIFAPKGGYNKSGGYNTSTESGQQAPSY